MIQAVDLKFQTSTKPENLKFLHLGDKIVNYEELIGNIGDGISEIEFHVVENVSMAYKKLNNIHILTRNIDECNKTAESNGNPR